MRMFLMLILFTGSAFAESNKAIVTKFYNLAFKDHKPEEAVKKYVGDVYVQHNPMVADGTKPFLDHFVPYFKEHPEATVDILRVIAEGDLVVLHVHAKERKEEHGRAVVDIFRVSKGKIVEHWDVAQPVPEYSKNKNTMF